MPVQDFSATLFAMPVHDFLVTLFAMPVRDSAAMPVYEFSVTLFAMPVHDSVAMPVHDSVCCAGPRLGLLCRSTIRFAMPVRDFSVILFAWFRPRVHFSSASFRVLYRLGLQSQSSTRLLDLRRPSRYA